MYSMGVLQVQLDLSFVDAIVLSVAVVAAASWVMGRLILRLDAQGILCATIAFSAIVALFIVTEKWMTMGVVGLGTIKYPVRIGGATEYFYFLLLLGAVVALQIFTLRLHRSTTGRLLIAIRDNEEVAASLGKDTYAVKNLWFVLTCVAMGAFGALSAPLNQFLTPNMIVPSVTFAVWIALVLGGKEHSLGAVVGVFITFGLFDILIETYVPVSPELAVYVPNIKLFVYGLLLVGVLMFKPAGLLEPDLPPEAVASRAVGGAKLAAAHGRRFVQAAAEAPWRRLSEQLRRAKMPAVPQGQAGTTSGAAIPETRLDDNDVAPPAAAKKAPVRGKAAARRKTVKKKTDTGPAPKPDDPASEASS